MSDFGTCNFGAITPELLVRSLLSGITAQPTFACGIRFQPVSTSGKTLSKVESCASLEDLMTIIQRSLMIGYDNAVAIRVNEVSSLEGAGLEVCAACQNAYSIEELLASPFVQDEDGVVYLNVINLTT